MPQRCAFWSARRTLILADLHLGKTNALRARGSRLPASLPQRLLDRQLDHLDQAIRLTRAERVLIVGDLLHAGIGLDAPLVDAVARRFARWRARIELIPGNHDRAIDAVAQRWGIRVLPTALVDGPFAFAHNPVDAPPGVFTWAGHVHPVLAMHSGADSARLPCFHLSDGLGLLPAFSTFTGGSPVRPAAADRVFAIVDNRVRLFLGPATDPPPQA